jgi:hypothetical protein
MEAGWALPITPLEVLLIQLVVSLLTVVWVLSVRLPMPVRS